LSSATPKPQTSKAGATINKLQKNSSTAIASIAKQIVAKWKQAVDAQKKRKRDANGDGAGEGSTEKKVKGEGGIKLKSEIAVSSGKSFLGSAASYSGIQPLTQLGSSAKGSPAPTSVKSENRPMKKERKLSTITTEKRPERSAKTDNPAGLEPDYRPGSSEKDDLVRKKGATMSYDALSFDSVAGKSWVVHISQHAQSAYQMSDQIEKAILVERSLALEQAVYDKMKQEVTDEYRSRMSSFTRAGLITEDSRLTSHTYRNSRAILESERTNKCRSARFHCHRCHLLQGRCQLHARGTYQIEKNEFNTLHRLMPVVFFAGAGISIRGD
jgi:transcription elongation factor S-II